jgi:WD40 repeat protein
MGRSPLTIVLLRVALLGLGVVFSPCGPNAALWSPPRLLAQDSADPKPAKDETPPDFDSLGEEQKEKIALVLETGYHTSRVFYLCFSPRDHELVSAAYDGTVRWWDLSTGHLIQVLRPRLGLMSAMALSHDARLVAVAGREDGEHVVQIINPRTGSVGSLKGHSESLSSLAFSGDGKWLAGVGHEQSLCLWSLDTEKTGKLAKVLVGHGSKAPELAFAPDNAHLATGGPKARVWQIPGGTSGLTFDRPVRSVAWSPDNKHIATAGPEGVQLWDVAGGKPTHVADTPAHVVAFSREPRKLLYVPTVGRSESPQEAVVCDLPGLKKTFAAPGTPLARGALSADGKLVALSNGENITVWRVADNKVLHRFFSPSRFPFEVGWSADGKTLGFGSIRVTDEERFEGRKPLEAAFSLDKLAFDPEAPLKTFQRAQLQREPPKPNGKPLSLAMDSSPKVVTVRGGKDLKVPGTVLCATFVDAERAAVGTHTGLYLFNTRTGEEVCRLVGHVRAIHAAAATADGHYLATAGADMTCRIWDLTRVKDLEKGKSLKPMLSLFFGPSHTWVAWTPEGYYACSPDGDELIGWLVDNGAGKLPTYHSVEHFRNVFYRPDVIRSLWPAGSLEQALWLIDKARAPIAVSEVLPPRVTITSPTTNGFSVDKPELTIEAFAESSGKDPVKALQLLLDGRPYPPDKGLISLKDARAGKTPPVSWPIQLPPGRHRLSIEARTEKTSGNSEELWVTNNMKPTPPRLFVLLIGINKYVKFNQLNCAVQDAEALEQAFLTNARGKPDLFGDVKTKPIKDTEATKKGILDGLDWLKDNVKEEDVAVVFYAGHGDKDKKDQFHLIAVDAEAGDKLPKTAVSGAEFKARLAALKSRRVLVLLDACHSGAIGTDDLARDLKRSDCGVAVLCAAEGSEYSRENPMEGHGYFTKWLLTGLQGGLKDDATKNAAGEVTLARLYAFVQEKVPEDTQDQQHPVLVGLAAIRSFALAKP